MTAEHTAPDVPVEMWLGSWLDRLLDEDPAFGDTVRDLTAGTFDEMLRVLGITGRSTVTVVRHAEGGTLAPPLYVRVNGRPFECEYSTEVLTRAARHVVASRWDGSWTASDAVARVADVAYTGDAETRRNVAAAFVAALARTAVGLQSGCLLGDAQVDAYFDVPSIEPAASRGDRNATASPDGAIPRADRPIEERRAILRDVVDLRISIADRATVLDTLDTTRDLPAAAVVEELVDALRPRRLEIHASFETLRALAVEATEAARATFPSLRESLFRDLGIVFPPFCFVGRADLAPNAVTFTLNHLSDPPLMFGESAAGSPPSGIAALVAAALDADLRLHRRCYVTLRQFDPMKGAFPDLWNTAFGLVSIHEATTVVRGLAADGVSLRDGRGILERIADWPAARQAVPGLSLEQFLRSAMVGGGARTTTGGSFAAAAR